MYLIMSASLYWGSLVSMKQASNSSQWKPPLCVPIFIAVFNLFVTFSIHAVIITCYNHNNHIIKQQCNTVTNVYLLWNCIAVPGGTVALSVEYRTCDREVVCSSLGRARGVETLGKFFTAMCLCSPSSISWCRPKGGDALRLGSKGRYGLCVGGR